MRIHLAFRPTQVELLRAVSLLHNLGEAGFIAMDRILRCLLPASDNQFLIAFTLRIDTHLNRVRSLRSREVAIQDRNCINEPFGLESQAANMRDGTTSVQPLKARRFNAYTESMARFGRVQISSTGLE